MTIAMDARAVFFVADDAVADETGGIQAVGVGRRVVRLGEDGQTPPLTLAALIDIPARYAGQDFVVAVELRSPETGEVVELPDINGAPGPFRIEQVVRAETGNFEGRDLPADLGARVQFLLGVPAGVPLEAGRTYRWFLEIDGRHDGAWTLPMYVAPGS